jgi:hypothetical protein
MANQKIAGKWRGFYHIPLIPEHDSAFTAFISESGGHIEGAIEDDCQLGEATLLGSFSFPSVQFTKVYLSQGRINEVVKRGGKSVTISAVYGPPIEYQGTMSDDGKDMSGTWTILSDSVLGHVPPIDLMKRKRKNRIKRPGPKKLKNRRNS